MLRKNAGVQPLAAVQAIAGERPSVLVLQLYVAGLTRPSMRALKTITAICEEQLSGRYDLEVIDITRHPDRADEDRVLAAPTLVKSYPLPTKRVIGDMSNRRRVLAGLGLPPP